VSHYLRMFAAMVMMVSGVAAHAEPIDYNPAKVSDSLKAIFQFGSVSTKKALNANTVTLLTGTIGGTYVQFGADHPSFHLAIGRKPCRSVPCFRCHTIAFRQKVQIRAWRGRR